MSLRLKIILALMTLAATAKTQVRTDAVPLNVAAEPWTATKVACTRSSSSSTRLPAIRERNRQRCGESRS